MSQAPGDDGADGVAGGGPAQSARRDCRRDAGSVRQRSRSGVCRGLPAGVLAATARQVGALPGRQGRGGESSTYPFIPPGGNLTGTYLFR